MALRATPKVSPELLRTVLKSATSVATDALNVHGGYGYTAEYGVERILRDLVSLTAAVHAATGYEARSAQR